MKLEFSVCDDCYSVLICINFEHRMNYNLDRWIWIWFSIWNLDYDDVDFQYMLKCYLDFRFQIPIQRSRSQFIQSLKLTQIKIEQQSS